MKRLSSCDSNSMAGLMSICPNSTDEENHHHHQNNNVMYSTEFQTMLEGFDEEECAGQVSEKKRRLGLEQVKALEKNFEVENKLEPERKLKLAQELGLQPRQVAVWFQNRRARWKTKQLERDYGVLKANYDGLKLNFDKLHSDNQSLLKQIWELKSKLDEGGNTEAKLETAVEKCGEADAGTETKDVNVCVFGDFKEGCSDSDSSAILNEECNNINSPPTATAAAQAIIPHHQFFTSSSSNLEFSEAAAAYQPQFAVKIEEHNFFGEESCTTNLFSEDQAPTLHWYCSDQWN